MLDLREDNGFFIAGPFSNLKCQPSPPPNPQGARAREVRTNQKLPTIFAKVRDVTGRHYNTQNSDVSLARAPCGLGGGDG